MKTRIALLVTRINQVLVFQITENSDWDYWHTVDIVIEILQKEARSATLAEKLVQYYPSYPGQLIDLWKRAIGDEFRKEKELKDHRTPKRIRRANNDSQ